MIENKTQHLIKSNYNMTYNWIRQKKDQSTSNCSRMPDFPLVGSMWQSRSYSEQKSTHAMTASPTFSASSRALYTNMYCSCIRNNTTRLRGTEHHLPHGIMAVLSATQHKWTQPNLTQANHDDTQLTYPEWMKSWVYLRGWLYIKIVYLPTDSYSQLTEQVAEKQPTYPPTIKFGKTITGFRLHQKLLSQHRVNATYQCTCKGSFQKQIQLQHYKRSNTTKSAGRFTKAYSDTEFTNW